MLTRDSVTLNKGQRMTLTFINTMPSSAHLVSHVYQILCTNIFREIFCSNPFPYKRIMYQSLHGHTLSKVNAESSFEEILYGPILRCYMFQGHKSSESGKEVFKDFFSLNIGMAAIL